MSKKRLVLLAGYPGTGKTYLSDLIQEKSANYTLVSQDTIKEAIYDRYGFDDEEEKEKLVSLSREVYYLEIENKMREGYDIISDYPFSDKQKKVFSRLALKYAYDILTVRMIGDLPVIYQRRVIRDLDSSRHPGHLVEQYHKGDIISDAQRQAHLISYRDFIDKCEESGYKDFALGEVVEIDATDFTKIKYDEVFKILDT